MIKCCRCKKEKTDISFNFKYKKLGIRAKACKECTRSEVRKHYYDNHEYYIFKANKRNRIIREFNRILVWKYLSAHPCIDCGEADPIVLEFDHMENKIDSIACVKRMYTTRSLEKEIAKCEIRCANCHRRKTSDQLGWHKLEKSIKLS